MGEGPTAAEMQAASDARMTEIRGSLETEVPEEVPADAARVKELMEEGGRVLCSVRARESGRHVTVLLTAKARDPAGGYVSRAKIAGRVGIGEAHTVFADDPDETWPDNKLGSFDLQSGEWRPDRDAEQNRLWASFALLRWALIGNLDLLKIAEVFVATTCCYCGKRLTDPVSVERGIGPECFKRRTGSRAAERHALLRDQ